MIILGLCFNKMLITISFFFGKKEYNTTVSFRGNICLFKTIKSGITGTFIL